MASIPHRPSTATEGTSASASAEMSGTSMPPLLKPTSSSMQSQAAPTQPQVRSSTWNAAPQYGRRVYSPATLQASERPSTLSRGAKLQRSLEAASASEQSHSFSASTGVSPVSVPVLEEYRSFVVSVPPQVAFNLLALPEGPQLFSVPAGIASCILLESKATRLRGHGSNSGKGGDGSGGIMWNVAVFDEKAELDDPLSQDRTEKNHMFHVLGQIRRTCISMIGLKDRILRERLVSIEKGLHTCKIVYEYLPLSNAEHEMHGDDVSVLAGTHPSRCPFAEPVASDSQALATDNRSQPPVTHVDPLEKARTYTTFTIQSIGSSSADVELARACVISVHTTVCFPELSQFVSTAARDASKDDAAKRSSILASAGGAGYEDCTTTKLRFVKDGITRAKKEADEPEWVFKEKIGRFISDEALGNVKLFFRRYNDEFCAALESYLLSLVFPIQAHLHTDSQCQEDYEEVEKLLVQWNMEAHKGEETGGDVGESADHFRAVLSQSTLKDGVRPTALAADVVPREEAISTLETALLKWAKTIMLYERSKRIVETMQFNPAGTALIAEQAANNLAALAASVGLNLQNEASFTSHGYSQLASGSVPSSFRMTSKAFRNRVSSLMRHSVSSTTKSERRRSSVATKLLSDYGTYWGKTENPLKALSELQPSPRSEQLGSSFNSSDGDTEGRPRSGDRNKSDKGDDALCDSLLEESWESEAVTGSDDVNPYADSVAPQFDGVRVRALINKGSFSESDARVIFDDLITCCPQTLPEDEYLLDAGKGGNTDVARTDTLNKEQMVVFLSAVDSLGLFEGKLSKEEERRRKEAVAAMGRDPKPTETKSGSQSSKITISKGAMMRQSRANEAAASLTERRKALENLADLYIRKYDYKKSGKLSFDAFCVLLLQLMK